jgi:allantoinase
MGELDLIVHGATVVTPTGTTQPLDVGVADGRIVALLPDLSEAAHETIHATGLFLFPGVIDSHVHFNEPGRAHWEGFATGSRAFAAGGGTLFFDMPLNSSPPTLDGPGFDLKLRAAQATSLTDFALWGGLVPHNLARLEELRDRGVIGLKAFMSASGIDDFPNIDDRTLREGMKRAAALKLPVAVHAESDAITRQLAEERLAQGRTTARDYLDSRPIAAELDAIRRALELAGETGCALHIVHVSSGEGVALIAKACREGVDVTCETCPHYLTLSDDDMLRLGPPAKCAPPLRSAPVREQLWEMMKSAAVDSIGSDHSPSPPEMKTNANFFKSWGGIAGIQHTLPLLLTEGHVKRGLKLADIARRLSTAVAARFRLPEGKGGICLGADADFVLVDLSQEFEIRKEDLLDRHRLSPYVGRRVRGKAVRTVLRGTTIFLDGKIVSKPIGRLVKPQPNA